MPLAAVLPFLSTLSGGLAAIGLRHRLRPFLAIAAGVVVATAIADLLPEAHELAGPSATLGLGGAALAGFLVFSLIEAFIHQGTFEYEHAATGAVPAARTASIVPEVTLGYLLAWFAGVFIAIGAGHVLPEARHREPRRGPLHVGLASGGAVVVLVIRAVAV